MATKPIASQRTCFMCMPASELVLRGGINLNHAKRADRRQDGQQPPVVIACSRCCPHDVLALRPKLRALIAGPRFVPRAPQQRVLEA